MEEKRKIKLLAIQMESIIGDLDLNIDTVKNLLRANLDKYGCVDFVFLPEVWTAGWDCSVFPKCAEDINNAKSVGMLRQVAKEYGVNIVGGSIVEAKEGKLFNTCPVINREGELVGMYNKNHLFTYYGDTEGNYITPGDKPVIVNIEGVKLGLSICYDIRFPEIYRAYRKAGADILVNMAAWPKSRKIHWDSLTTARAVENQSYFVALTQTGLLSNGEENLGHSMIIDYEGKVMDEIEEIEGAIYAEAYLEKMYEFRNKCTVLKDIKNSYEVVIK